jgi:hypothetical protein
MGESSFLDSDDDFLISSIPKFLKYANAASVRDLSSNGHAVLRKRPMGFVDSPGRGQTPVAAATI